MHTASRLSAFEVQFNSITNELLEAMLEFKQQSKRLISKSKKTYFSLSYLP
jgi:hypothetical protein